MGVPRSGRATSETKRRKAIVIAMPWLSTRVAMVVFLVSGLINSGHVLPSNLRTRLYSGTLPVRGLAFKIINCTWPRPTCNAWGR